MRLRPKETDLLGKWAVVKGEVVRDATSDRIETLTEQHLEKIAGGGWETLFRDPGDGRYWERTYPESSWHGGGPPRLTYLSNEQARAKYGEVVQ